MVGAFNFPDIKCVTNRSNNDKQDIHGCDAFFLPLFIYLFYQVVMEPKKMTLFLAFCFVFFFW